MKLETDLLYQTIIDHVANGSSIDHAFEAETAGDGSRASPRTSSRRQEWRRKLIVKRRPAKSVKEIGRAWYEHRSLSVQGIAGFGLASIDRLRSLQVLLPSMDDWKQQSLEVGPNSDFETKDKSGRLPSLRIRQDYVLKELMETEENYVTQLARFIHTYGQEMKSPNLPDSLKGKYNLIFGNIDEVYSFHMNTFLPALKNSHGVLGVAECFSSKESELLRVYVVYCENKPRSETFLANFHGTLFEDIQQQLGDRLQLPDYLIKPVQRIMKYSLLLKDLLKVSHSLGNTEEVLELEKALKVTSDVPKQANNAMQLSMIEGYEGNIHAVGELLLKDEFLVSNVRNGDGRQRKSHVFLLEQVVILAVLKGKQEGKFNDSYVCKDTLKIKEIGVNECGTNDERRFELWTGKISNPRQKYQLEAMTDDIKWTWVKQIGKLLSEQLHMMRALKGLDSQRKHSSLELTVCSTLARVESFIDSEDDLVDEEDQWKDLTLSTQSLALSTQPLSSSLETYVAAFGYSTNEDDTKEGIISFQQGQQFQVIDESSEQWWLVRTAGKDDSVVEGWVPASYLETEEDYEEMIKNEQMKLSQSSCELDHEIPEFTEQDQSQSATDEGHQELECAEEHVHQQHGNGSSLLDVHNYTSITRKGSFRRKTSPGSGRSQANSSTSKNEDAKRVSFIQRFPRKARCCCGSVVTLTCTPQLSGLESEVFAKWTRDEMEIHISSKYSICQDGNTFSLTLKDLEPSDAAQYRCIVTCGDLSGVCSCHLLVSAPEEAILYNEVDQYYDLGTKIGHGRFATVKLCTEKSSGVDYAAKIFHKFTEETRDAFQAELVMLSILRHPQIVTLHQAFESSNSRTLILQRIVGQELFEHVVSGDCISEKVACEYIKRLLDPIRYMHSRFVAHLDLKPENIMVATDEAEIFRIKLIDFGSSKKVANEPLILKVIGNAEFCAPEVVRNEPLSLASDMWSLGAITYTLLTGFSPFYAETVSETAVNIAAVKCSYQTAPWRKVSEKAKLFVQNLLRCDSRLRRTVEDCLEDQWIKDSFISTDLLDTSRLRAFIARRKWQRDLVTESVLIQPVSCV